MAVKHRSQAELKMKLKEIRQWITANTKTSWGTRKNNIC
jgi:hypothetical protein